MEISESDRTATPVGSLNGVDLSDIETQKSILCYDKHQILEGSVFEEYFDREITSVGPLATHLQQVKAQTAIVGTADRKSFAFVLVEEASTGIGRYLQRLTRIMPVWYVRYDAALREFIACKVESSNEDSLDERTVRFSGEPRPLMSVVREVSNSKRRPYDVAAEIKDGNRQNTAFWGGLFPSLGKGKIEKLVLSRIFFNFCMTEYFRFVWNIDKVYVSDKDIWSLEIKHKFPFGRGRLGFGINDGELKNMKLLARAGIRNLHVVVVKPVWDKNYPTQVLFNESLHFKNTVIIGREISEGDSVKALDEIGGRSGEHTSLEGRARQPYKVFHAESFYKIGLKSDDGVNLSTRLSDLIAGVSLESCTDEYLRSHEVRMAA